VLRVEQIMPGRGLVPVGEGRRGEMMKRGEYGANAVYICM
jgi:hypothetical protein